uniref:L-Fucosyltransferase n=2 Tax=Plectus sambesii TaxID=2011161 RepID=A0A914VX25_9BILA
VSNFTFSPGLGNMMFQYASLRALAERQNASLIVPVTTLLRRAFDITGVLVSDAVEEELITELRNTYTDVKRYYPDCCRYYPEAETVFNDGRSLQLYMGYFQSFRYFHPDREDMIRREFKLLPAINERAHQFLLTARKKMKENSKMEGKFDSSNVTYVGMHVRRGIDVTWNLRNIEHGHKVATKRYLTRAMDYYREKYRNVVFLLCSDDLKWCRENIEQEMADVMTIDSGFREIDLAVMAMCNHTIMTIGTFSWWAAYLAGGEVIYYKEWPRKGSKLAEMLRSEEYFLPNWIGMD